MDKLPPTPETDGMTFLAQPGMMPPYNTVSSEFARKLERERNELRSALESIEDRFVDGENTYDDWLFMATTARTVLYELRNHLR
jgi:hypothetical protein